jgi:lipoprotein-anchoring transpeptidase ErfK/SrfK
MKKLAILCSMCSMFLLSGCSMNGLFSSGANYDKPPHLIHHNEDKKGRAHFPKHRDTGGKRVFIFDPKAAAWAAYNESGKRVKTGRASGGKDFCPDIQERCRTVVGKFRVNVKRGGDCVSKKFPIGVGGAPMPHCMFFHGGYAIHGSYHIPNGNASHGCIRVTPSAAEWLSDNFMRIGTTVIVSNY